MIPLVDQAERLAVTQVSVADSVETGHAVQAQAIRLVAGPVWHVIIRENAVGSVATVDVAKKPPSRGVFIFSAHPGNRG